MSSQARKLFSLKTILDFLAFFAFIILNMLYSKYYFLCVFIEISISLNICNFFPAFFLFRSVIVTIIFVHLLVHYEFFISIFTPFLLLLLLLICGISLGRQVGNFSLTQVSNKTEQNMFDVQSGFCLHVLEQKNVDKNRLRQQKRKTYKHKQVQSGTQTKI